MVIVTPFLRYSTMRLPWYRNVYSAEVLSGLRSSSGFPGSRPSTGPDLDALHPGELDLLLLGEQHGRAHHLLARDEGDDRVVDLPLAVLQPDLAAEGVEEPLPEHAQQLPGPLYAIEPAAPTTAS